MAAAFVRTRISVSGFTAEEVLDGLADLIEEFGQRPWIVNPGTFWDSSRCRLVVTTHYEGSDADSGRQTASDEVWDCVIACINFSSEGIRFEIEDSVVVPDATSGTSTTPGTT